MCRLLVAGGTPERAVKVGVIRPLMHGTAPDARLDGEREDTGVRVRTIFPILGATQLP